MKHISFLVALAVCLFTSSLTWAEEPPVKTTEAEATSKEGGPEEAPPEPHSMEFAEGMLLFEVAGDWKKVEPRIRLIASEFQVPMVAVDEENADEPAAQVAPGRMTVMQSGGSVEANVNRWKGQFKIATDADGEAAFEQEDIEAGSLVIHKIDIGGVYSDAPRGPFGPKVARPDYRMIALIIETPSAGNWYVKFYGSKELVDSQAEAFDALVKSIKWKSDEEKADADSAE